MWSKNYSMYRIKTFTAVSLSTTLLKTADIFARHKTADVNPKNKASLPTE